MFAAGSSPADADALNQRGNASRGCGRLEDALADYDRALGVKSDHPAALYNRGVVLLLLQRPAEALAGFDRLLALTPDDAEAHNERGNALAQLDRPGDALAAYDRALALQPGYAAALYHRGMALRALRRPAEALESFDSARGLDPESVAIELARGEALQELGRHAEAFVSFNRVLEREPDNPDALCGRALVQHDLKRPAEALRDIDRADTLRPQHGMTILVRGIALQDLQRHDEALRCYDRALELLPGNPIALNNRGNTLREMGRPQAALAVYDEVLALDPSHAQVHFNQSICRLQTGDFTEGWRQYEWRWPANALDAPRREFREPLWLGETPLAGRAIMLHAEQGVGDTLQFCRYATLAAATGATVYLQVQDALLRLLRGLPGVRDVFVGGDPLPVFDLQSPLLSLPLAFGTTLATIPAQVPYLECDATRAAHWRSKLGPTTAPRIGLVWSGAPGHKNDHNRSIPLALMAGLLRPGAEFVSLQKEVRAADADVLAGIGTIRHFGDALADFADTAALIEQLDLVIAVDTSVAHLAGALGKPVWILLPYVADFRWLLDRDDSPWYPTARLFRQPRIGDWDSVIARVAAEFQAQFDRMPPRLS